MSAIKELIRAEDNGGISFGDPTLQVKTKKEDFEYDGDLYYVKTFNEITKLERNGMFVYESVPGTAVSDFIVDDNSVSFTVEGEGDAQITLQLAEDKNYGVYEDNISIGEMKTNMSGKISISVDFTGKDSVYIKVIEC